MTDPGSVGMGVRAALHALDAALAEHRRALALAAGRREAQRMARGREVKAVARASDAALEQPVERPMRALRLADTWIEVDRSRHPLTADVRAAFTAGELLVGARDWSARLVVAPGDGPATAAREAVARIEAAVPAAVERARARLQLAVSAGVAHAAACHDAAAALAAADREAAERHADSGRLAACVEELSERLGPRSPGEPPELAAARGRLEQARAHLAAVPEQPFAWVQAWPAPLAGAILRDVPEDRMDVVQPALVRLAGALGRSEPLLALGAGDGAVAAVAPERVAIAGELEARWHRPGAAALAGDALTAGEDAVTRIAEARPGRLAAALELVAGVERLRQRR